MDKSRPLFVSMGDPVGIGPEIIMQAHARGALAHCVVVGDVEVLQRAADVVGWRGPLPLIEGPTEGLPEGLSRLPWGRVAAEAGLASVRCVEQAIRAVQAGRGRALVTAPIHKGAWAAAGLTWPGHTELLQQRASEALGRSVPVRMMLANRELKVVLVTIHVSLREALDAIDTPSVLQTIDMTHAALTATGAQARIAVAGLNPHAGEGGLFGQEETQHIAPAVAAARAKGIQVSGPYAPDTVFMRARRGEFDAVVAMTHDHGLIPVKYMGVEDGVNVTLGLPWVRTSPDHGTAFDIAGRGVADPSSLLAAIDLARALT